MKAAHIAALALKDTRHEWRMSVCMILAVAAIATPLLLFFGLKYGTIETLRSRLLDNPATLEIMPLTDKMLDEAWFESWRKNPQVAFLVPHTRKLSAQADIALANGVKPLKRVDIQPTMPGDIQLTRFNLPVPGLDECVLSERAAELAGVKSGDKITLQVTRENARVKATHEFSVKGVLPPRAGALPVVYMPLEQLEAIEDFKDGRAVAVFGWPGSDPVAYPVFPSVLIFVPKVLDSVREVQLIQNTGFGFLDKLENTDAAAHRIFGEFFGVAYRLRTAGSPAGEQNIATVREKLRGLGALIVPEAYPLRLHPNNLADGADFDLVPGLAAALDALLPGLPLPEGLPLANWASLNALSIPFAVLVSPSLAGKLAAKGGLEREIRIEFSGEGERSVTFKATFIAGQDVQDGVALLPLSLLGALNLLEQRPLLAGRTEQGGNALLLGRRGYSGFRMYADGLETVAPLAGALEADGIKVNTRADRIDEVLRLDQYLDLLFWVIAAASLAGGTACLLSSIYANVERKRRDLAVLRLLGVHGGALIVFPLVSGFILTIGGLGLGLGIFHALSAAINFFFSAHLEPGEQFCLLTPYHQVAALGISICLA
ncbi:MAG: hypothetical protein LBV76_04645, partial [Deltaproteobacteria bacterium]|nr:hypothetical protein [Deltaproteobacteria bacterium]